MTDFWPEGLEMPEEVAEWDRSANEIDFTCLAECVNKADAALAAVGKMLAAVTAERDEWKENAESKQAAFAAFQSNLPQALFEVVDRAFDDFDWNALIARTLSRYRAQKGAGDE